MKNREVKIMIEQVGIALIGCGYWGINYIRVLNELPGARVVAVCDQRAERLEEIAGRFPGVQLTTDIDDVLRMSDVDAAIVCTPAKTHHSVARACLSAGKHVLVEKPITTTVADADDLIAVAESTGTTLMVGHTFIYNSGIRKIKQYLVEGEVSQVYYVYARRTNLGPIRHDVNALWDLAPHDVSIFNYLLDSTPEWVSAVGIKILRECHEDVGFISLGYPNGVVGHIHVSWADPNKVREIVVVGSDKRIAFDDLNPRESVRIFDKGAVSVPAAARGDGAFDFMLRDGDIISPQIDFSEPLRNECSHFLECITQGIHPLTGGNEGREVVQVMQAIEHSIERQGARIEMGEKRYA
jgi:predicted dehydrogenase